MSWTRTTVNTRRPHGSGQVGGVAGTNTRTDNAQDPDTAVLAIAATSCECRDPRCRLPAKELWQTPRGRYWLAQSHVPIDSHRTGITWADLPRAWRVHGVR